MNYLREINSFRLYLKTNPIPATAQALWYVLIDYHNSCGWERWITIDNLRLQAELMISKPTLHQHRLTLIQMGLIEYKSQQKKKNSGKYRLLSFELGEVTGKETGQKNCPDLKTGKDSGQKIYPDSETGKEILPESLPDLLPDPLPESFPDPLHLNKLNKTKPNKGGKDISPPPPEEPKTLFLEFVRLTGKEHQKLTENMGEVFTAEYIERLNGYIGQIGEKQAAKKYTSHYHTITNWWRKDGKPQGKSPPEKKLEHQSGLSYLRQKIDGG
jgi:hypothetical protein